jgi:hypothetical protein
MKAEFIKIAQDLEQGKIDEPKAQALLLGLFDVSGMFCNYEHNTCSSKKGNKCLAKVDCYWQKNYR